jgi:hypothetical protein
MNTGVDEMFTAPFHRGSSSRGRGMPRSGMPGGNGRIPQESEILGITAQKLLQSIPPYVMMKSLQKI